MYGFIVLCVLIVVEKANSQGDTYIKLIGPVGDVGVNSTITFTCHFRKISKKFMIDLNATDENDHTAILKRWVDDTTEVTYQSYRDGYVQYKHTVTGPGKYRCVFWQYEPDSSAISNKYSLHIWQARMKDFPANFTESETMTVNCSVRWAKYQYINFTWSLGRDTINKENHTATGTINTDGTFHVTSSLTYTFHGQDDGKYLKCEARDKVDRTLSDTARKRLTILWDTESTTDSTIQTTTTNTTRVMEKEGPSYKLYVLLSVLGLVVVAVVICVFYVTKWWKKEAKKRNSMRSERQENNEETVKEPSPPVPSQGTTEGMVYAELEMVKAKASDTGPSKTTTPQVIHGTENMVEYASIAWDKNAIVE